MVENKGEILDEYRELSHNITDTSLVDSEMTRLSSEIAIISELIKKCIDENAHTVIDQNEYEKRYNSLLGKYQSIKKELEKT